MFPSWNIWTWLFLEPPLLKFLEITTGDIVAYRLMELFHVMIRNGQYSDEQKEGDLSCLFKKNDRSNKVDYRPITMLPDRLMIRTLSLDVVSVRGLVRSVLKDNPQTQPMLRQRILGKLNPNMEACYRDEFNISESK